MFYSLTHPCLSFWMTEILKLPWESPVWVPSMWFAALYELSSLSIVICKYVFPTRLCTACLVKQNLYTKILTDSLPLPPHPRRQHKSEAESGGKQWWEWNRTKRLSKTLAGGLTAPCSCWKKRRPRKKNTISSVCLTTWSSEGPRNLTLRWVILWYRQPVSPLRPLEYTIVWTRFCLMCVY